jgi:uncharacterized membrane protein YvbJ
MQKNIRKIYIIDWTSVFLFLLFIIIIEEVGDNRDPETLLSLKSFPLKNYNESSKY